LGAAGEDSLARQEEIEGDQENHQAGADADPDTFSLLEEELLDVEFLHRTIPASGQSWATPGMVMVSARVLSQGRSPRHFFGAGWSLGALGSAGGLGGK